MDNVKASLLSKENIEKLIHIKEWKKYYYVTFNDISFHYFSIDNVIYCLHVNKNDLGFLSTIQIKDEILDYSTTNFFLPLIQNISTLLDSIRDIELIDDKDSLWLNLEHEFVKKMIFNPYFDIYHTL